MWLLYVTFEDFVCLRHPKRARAILSSSVDIESYISSPKVHPRRDCVKETTESNFRGPLLTSTPRKERFTGPLSCDRNELNNQLKTTQSSNDKDQTELGTIYDLNQGNKIISGDQYFSSNQSTTVIVSAQIAKISRLRVTKRAKSHRNQRKFNTRRVNGEKALKIPLTDQREKKTNTMHDINEQGITNNANACTPFKCVNSEGTDKATNSRDIISVFQTQPQSALFWGCSPRHKQTSTQEKNNETCERYNPTFNVENKCLNQWDDQLGIRNPVQTQVSHNDRQAGAVNVRGALQTIADTDNKCCCNGHEPCVTDKLSVQSKCWNQLRLSGILPYDGKSNMKIFGSTPHLIRNQRRNELLHSSSVDESLLETREPMSLPVMPTRNSFPNEMTIANNSNQMLCSRETEEEEKASRSNDYGFMRTKPPQSLPLDINITRKKHSVHNVSVDLCNSSNESSPVTISSGYESDSLATREADIDTILFNNKQNKEKTGADETGHLTDYFSMSDSGHNVEGLNVSKENLEPEATKVDVATVPERSAKAKTPKRKEKAVSKHKKNKLEKDKNKCPPTSFTPKERHNYKLTKVARTMFEIIHDLQTDDSSPDSKKKTRKMRRNSPPVCQGDAMLSQDGTPQTPPTTPMTPTTPSAPNAPFFNSTTDKNDDEANHSNSNILDSLINNEPKKITVKCLRRPLGSDPSDFERCLPHSDSARASAPQLPESYEEQDHPTGTEHIDWNKVSFFRKTGQVSRNTDHQHAPHANEIINGNWSFGLPECTPYATTRLPGCQTPQRNHKDDHVYETIPGDEFLYDELMKMRMNGITFPKFRKVPEFPGAFVPYEAPALPARNDHRLMFRAPPVPSHPPPQSPRQEQQPFKNHQSPMVNSNIPQTHPGSHRRTVPHFHPVPHIQNILQAQSVSAFQNSPQFQSLPVQQSKPVGKFRPREAFENTCQSRPLPGVPNRVRGRSEAREPRQSNVQLQTKQTRPRVQSQPPLQHNRLNASSASDRTQPISQTKTCDLRQHRPDKYFLRDVNANVPDRASFCVTSTSKSSQKMDTTTYRSRSASWDGYGTLDSVRREKERSNPSHSLSHACISTSDLLSCVDDMEVQSSKRRENFYLLLSNRQKRADFSESLEIENKLRSLGVVLTPPNREFLDEDGYTTMDGVQPLVAGNHSQIQRLQALADESKGPQFLQSTYV